MGSRLVALLAVPAADRRAGAIWLVAGSVARGAPGPWRARGMVGSSRASAGRLQPRDEQLQEGCRDRCRGTGNAWCRLRPT